MEIGGSERVLDADIKMNWRKSSY